MALPENFIYISLLAFLPALPSDWSGNVYTASMSCPGNLPIRPVFVSYWLECTNICCSIELIEKLDDVGRYGITKAQHIRAFLFEDCQESRSFTRLEPQNVLFG